MFVEGFLFSAGYLIIAMPQSSSTSFQTDVAKASKLSYDQEFVCNRENIKIWNHSFAGMHMHSDTCTLPSSVLNRWIFSTRRIFKQHVVPDSNNTNIVRQALLKGARIVYLSRDPVQSGHAACERLVAERRKVDITTIERKIDALRLWRAEWNAVFDNQSVHRVTYNHLRYDNKKNVKDILNFWNLSFHTFNDSKARLVNHSSRTCNFTRTRAYPDK